jgi:hypothetical protein
MSGAEGQERRKNARCAVAEELLASYSELVTESLTLHEMQFQSVVSGNADSGQYQRLIDQVNSRKENTKTAYIQHLRNHRCSSDWMLLDERKSAPKANAADETAPRKAGSSSDPPLNR